MVAAHGAAGPHPRLLPGRGRAGPALLAVPGRPLRPRGRGPGAVLVDARDVSMTAPAYAELGVRTNFSFLEGASHPGEMARQARALGLAALGVADRNTLAGVVR